jgi:copper chaperone CopZ
MTCGQCVKSLENAFGKSDPQARLRADLAGKKIFVSSQTEPEKLLKIIEDAGFSAALSK